MSSITSVYWFSNEKRLNFLTEGTYFSFTLSIIDEKTVTATVLNLASFDTYQQTITCQINAEETIKNIRKYFELDLVQVMARDESIKLIFYQNKSKSNSSTQSILNDIILVKLSNSSSVSINRLSSSLMKISKQTKDLRNNVSMSIIESNLTNDSQIQSLNDLKNIIISRNNMYSDSVKSKTESLESKLNDIQKPPEITAVFHKDYMKVESFGSNK